MPCRIPAVLLVLLVLISPFRAAAQSPFVPAEGYFVGPGTSNGLSVDPSFQNFQVDADGNGQFDPGEPTYPLPTAFLQTVANSDYRLSPTRRHIVLFGQAINGPCVGNLSYYVYRLPPTPGDPLEIAGPPICVDTGESTVGFFDPTGSTENDVFFVVETSDAALEQQVWWKRLADGTTSAGSFPFDKDVGAITFAPSGIAAFVQYDVGGLDAVDSYQMIELCADDFGDYVGTAQGSVIDLAGGDLAVASQLNATDVEVRLDSDQSLIASYVLDDCAVAPITGACCLSDGSCSPGMTESGCSGAGGTWQGAGVDCAGLNCPPPPAVELVVTGSGPGQISAPGSITWTLDVSNVGDLDAGGTTLTALLPSTVTFAAASGGGSFNPLNGRVIWSLGTLVAGGSDQLTVTVDVDCGVTEVVLATYFAQSASPVSLVFGSPPVTTAVTSGGGGLLDVRVTSVSDTGLPPEDGDTATHTIELIENDGVARTAARFDLGIGSVWAFDTLVDGAGGSVNTDFNRFAWQGNVSASDTTRVVFRTRLPSCRSVHQVRDVLNSGFAFNVLDGCNTMIGSGVADTVDFAPIPVSASVSATGIGPVAPNGFFGPTALARKGSPIQFEAVVRNDGSATQSNVVLSFTVPDGLVASADPPWTDQPPAGSTWDAATATAQWSGELVSGAQVRLRVAVDYPSDGPCRFDLAARFGYGACSNAGREGIRILGLDPAITDPHVVSVTAFQGLWSYRPGVDTEQQVFLCANYEIQTSLARGLGEALWVGGTPAFRFDPISLDLEFVDAAFLDQRAGLISADHVAVDRSSGLVVFGGRRNVPGPMSYPRVVAWDRTADQVTVLLDETNPRTHYAVNDLAVLDDGRVAITTTAGLVIVDPASPATGTVWTDPRWTNGTMAGGLAVRSDGDVLVAERDFTPTNAKGLRVVDPDTGVVTSYVDDLLAVFSLGVITHGVDLDANDQPWLSIGSPVLLQGDPNAMLLDTAFGGQGTDVDVVWSAGATSTAAPDDAATPRPRAWALHAPVPNPFNPRTTIAFDLPSAGPVAITLFDARGRRVRTLVEGSRDAGTHRIVWDGLDDQGRAVSSGVYFVRMDGGGQRMVRKAVLLR